MLAPSARSQAASLRNSASTREVKKPGPSPTTITVLPMRRPSSTTVASASSEVPGWRITSRSGILWTGLKKCMPATCLRPAARLGQTGDGDRRGVGGEDEALGRRGLGLPDHRVLDPDVLEHGLDDQVHPLEGGVVDRGHGPVRERS